MVESRLHSAACSSLSICRVFELDLHPSKLVRHARETLDALRARGAAAEWLSAGAANVQLFNWAKEYP
jgi:hypothetical protein